MRFLADMGVSQRVVDWLRAQGHEAIHLREQRLHRLPDPDIFAKAVVEGRIVITFDLDFTEIAAHARAKLTSVVVLRVRDTTTAAVIGRLSSVLDHCRDALTAGAIVTVEDTRHRVRILPIGGAD